jgi:carbonic anhydrase
VAGLSTVKDATISQLFGPHQCLVLKKCRSTALSCNRKYNDREAHQWRIEMSLIEHAITSSRASAKNYDASLAEKPAPKVAIITCMDPRMNGLLERLDIKPADADLIRNVGTVVTDDVVRSLMFSIHVLGVKEIMIVGHTGCGMELFTDEAFEKHLYKRTGLLAVSPAKFHFYTDANEATSKQISKLRSHPWIPEDVAIRGFVQDLVTGELKEVSATVTYK